jgi:hypothetical protein
MTPESGCQRSLIAEWPTVIVEADEGEAVKQVGTLGEL